LLLEIGLLSRSLAPVVGVVRSVHAFALFSGIQRHAAATMTATTATTILPQNEYINRIKEKRERERERERKRRNSRVSCA
jgi:hypothetical protein